MEFLKPEEFHLPYAMFFAPFVYVWLIVVNCEQTKTNKKQKQSKQQQSYGL